MQIAVVGLGLIGGSFCKAIKAYTHHTCLGVGRDLNSKSVQMALHADAIDKAIIPEQLGAADLSIICLHPQGIIDFILENQQYFRPGSIVIEREYCKSGAGCAGGAGCDLYRLPSDGRKGIFRLCLFPG